MGLGVRGFGGPGVMRMDEICINAALAPRSRRVNFELTARGRARVRQVGCPKRFGTGAGFLESRAPAAR